MRKLEIIICIAASLLLSGCAAKKKAAKTEKTEVKTEKVHVVTIQEKVIGAQPDFQTVSAQKVRFSINYQQRQLSANGSITMVKDSILIISVQPLLGIELLRVEVTKTDMTVVDKMNKRYMQMSYDEVRQELGVPVRYDDLQALAMNRLFVANKPQNWLTENRLETESADGKTTLQFREGKVKYKYIIDERLLIPLSLDLSMEGNSGTSRVEYNGHNLHDGILFASQIRIVYNGSDLQGEGIINLPNISFNGAVNASRVRLNNYKKTTLTAIISGK